MPKYKIHISISRYEGVNADHLINSIRQHLMFHDFEGVISPETNVILCFKNKEDYDSHLGRLDNYLNSLEKQFDYVLTIVPSPYT